MHWFQVIAWKGQNGLWLTTMQPTHLTTPSDVEVMESKPGISGIMGNTTNGPFVCIYVCIWVEEGEEPLVQSRTL